MKKTKRRWMWSLDTSLSRSWYMVMVIMLVQLVSTVGELSSFFYVRTYEYRKYDTTTSFFYVRTYEYRKYDTTILKMCASPNIERTF